MLTLFLALTAFAEDPEIPNLSWTTDQIGTRLSPDMQPEQALNQPVMVRGALLLAGNGQHSLWDIHDPLHPERLSTFDSPHHDGEAESHSVALRRVDDQTHAALISGLGVDLWDLTDPAAPVLMSTIELDGVNYGDNTEAVWGVAWQGRWLYAGGTNTGLHVIDTLDPRAPEVVHRMSMNELGGVSAGPVFAHGNLLVVTTPKEHAGVATVDISIPDAPSLLDFDLPEEKSYIGGFYGGNAYLITPLRTYDVTSDPSNIQLLDSVETPANEYLTFADGHAWLGGLRPNPGVRKFRLGPDGSAELVTYIEGRRDDFANGFFTDDQFALPVGNLLVIADDEISIGAWITPVDTRPDTTAPTLMSVYPPDGATRQPTTTRIGLSFSDQLDSRSIGPDTIILRSLDTGETIPAMWGLQHTVVNVSPLQPLEQDTAYEVVVDGITDLVGNPLAETARTVFSTGGDLDIPACNITLAPTLVDTDSELASPDAASIDYTWDFGDGDTSQDGVATHRWTRPGRYTITLTAASADARRSCTATQIVTRAPSPTPPTSSSTIAIDDARRLAWVVLNDHDQVSAIDLDSHTLVAEVEVPDDPRTLSVAPDGTVWVACQASDMLVAIDPDAGSILETHTLRWGASPYGVVATDSEVFVTYEYAGTVVRLQRSSGEIVDAGQPDMGRIRDLTVHDGQILVSRFTSPFRQAQVLSSTGTPIRLHHDDTPDDHDQGRGTPNYLAAPVVAPDGMRMAIPSKKDNIERGEALDGEALDADNTVRSIVSWVDLELDAEDEAARVDLDDHEGPTASVFSPLGDVLFVASRGTNQIDALDAWTGNRLSGISTGRAPIGVAMSADGLLVVDESVSRTVSIIDTRTVLDATDATMRRLAEVPSATWEALEDDVLLGKELFHLADSQQMSQDGYLSCATCHVDGSDDGQTWDFTDRGEGLRNTIDLRGRAGLDHGPLHWTGNFDEVQDFEHDIRGSFGGAGLLDDDVYDTVDEPLGAPKAGLSPRLDALAAYVATFDSYVKSPHRTAEGDLTEDAQKGRRIFETSGCLDCHTGPALTDSISGLRHDVGTALSTSGERLGSPLDGFDTPTLLNLHATAPYLHDGRAADLLDDAVFGVDHVGSLSDKQKSHLVAFLMQLEEDQVATLENRACGCSGGGPSPWWILPMLLWRKRRGLAQSP